MATSSGKNLLCFIHVGGKFLNVGGHEMQYVGGMVRTRCVKESTTYEELLRIISSITGNESNEIQVKFKVSIDTSTFVDLVDDEGVDHFMKYNEQYGHVYIEDDGDDENTVPTFNGQMEEQEVIDQMFVGAGGLCMSPPPLLNESQDVPSLECCTQLVPTPIPGMNHTKWKDLIIGEGQIFPNGMSLRQTLYKYSISHKFSYQFVKNNKQKIIVKCKVSGCPWYMGAYSSGEHQDTEFLTIRTYKSEHIHHAQDSLIVWHPHRSSLTSSIVMDDLRSNIDKTSNEIRADLYREYGVRLNYPQAYRAKERALKELNGRVEDSYQAIPWICDRLIESDPDTVAKWEGSSNNRFERVFIAYGCSVKGFIGGCRPIVYIDGCHLSGPYKGTMLSACAYDADNQMFPLAYSIVSGETYDEWLWFLLNLKEIIGSIMITIVSDRNNAIIGAVKEIFGSERHGYCYRHVKENYSAEFLKINRGRARTSATTKETALKLLDAIAYARLDEDFISAMGKLRLFNPQLAQWVETNGDVDKWALSKFPFNRWDNITTNIAESFNAWMLKERKHSVSILIHEHRDKLARKLLASKMAMANWKNGVGPNVEEKVLQHVTYAENMDAVYYGDHNFSVRTRCGEATIYVNVDLAQRKCTCLAWQMSGIPCAHACAAIKVLNGNVYTFVHDWLKVEAQEKIYGNTMRPVATHDCPRADSPTVTHLLTQTFLDPPTTTRPAGRPKRKRRESQFQNKKLYHCGRCHEVGHSVRTCKNPNPT